MSFTTSKATTIELDATIQADEDRFEDIKAINQLWHEGKYKDYLEMFKTILQKVVKPANYSYNTNHKRKSFTFHTMLLVTENYAMRIKAGKLAEDLHIRENMVIPEYRNPSQLQYLTQNG